MKKIFALVSFLALAAACTQPSTNTETTSNANKPMETKSTSMSDADVTTREKSVWETLVKKDYDGFGKMLASDYMEVENDGVYDKAGIIAYVKDINITDVTYSDWKVVPVDKDATLLTYNVTVKETDKNGKAAPPGPYHAASAWINRDGKWLGIYYQETEAAKPSPSPSPSASQPAKPAGSPAKMAEAGADPVANEKLVWDALKSRNYDAFAGYLAPDSIEIEADGVYDKAGSVKGVSMFDATKYDLSEWKTVKFDNDASLVTYMVTSRGPNHEQERHSTIWVNRGGKWMALLHVGTPVKPAEKSTAKPETKKM
jgi:hypothetical protein